MDYQKQKWKKFSEISRREKWLLIEAVLLHLWVGLMLKIIPFRWIPRLFSSRQPATGSQQQEVIDSIRSAIQRAGRVSPWRNRCLVSSLAGRCMFRRRKISSTISLGVAKNAMGKTVAHAWITADDTEIVSGGTSFHELFQF